MYFPVEEKTFLIGDGKYTNEDGSYYMYTDAGYMRNILYFGILGFIFLFLYQISFFIWDYKNLFINFIILIYILIMHVKGDVLAFSIILQNMLLINFIYSYGKKKETVDKFG